MSTGTDERQLAVLLGASNLRRGLAHAVAEVRRRRGPRVEIYGALGHGRSFAMSSTFVVRTMPGILQSGLWTAIARLPRAKTLVLMTDVGNDLVYGASAVRISGWVEECLARLPESAQVTVTLLPMESLRGLSEARFALFRRFFFPGRSLQLNDLLSEAEVLSARLEALVQDSRVTIVEPAPGWYGLDPIHIRAGAQAEAWSEILGGWGDAESTLEMPLAARVRVLCCRPEQASVLGFKVGTQQPSLELEGGTVVGLF